MATTTSSVTRTTTKTTVVNTTKTPRRVQCHNCRDTGFVALAYCPSCGGLSRQRIHQN